MGRLVASTRRSLNNVIAWGLLVSSWRRVGRRSVVGRIVVRVSETHLESVKVPLVATISAVLDTNRPAVISICKGTHGERVATVAQVGREPGPATFAAAFLEHKDDFFQVIIPVVDIHNKVNIGSIDHTARSRVNLLVGGSGETASFVLIVKGLVVNGAFHEGVVLVFDQELVGLVKVMRQHRFVFIHYLQITMTVMTDSALGNAHVARDGTVNTFWGPVFDNLHHASALVFRSEGLIAGKLANTKVCSNDGGRQDRKEEEKGRCVMHVDGWDFVFNFFVDADYE